MYYKMHDIWREYGPPVYIGIACAYGIVGKKKENGNLEDLARMFPGGQIRG